MLNNDQLDYLIRYACTLDWRVSTGQLSRESEIVKQFERLLIDIINYSNQSNKVLQFKNNDKKACNAA